MIDEKIEYFAVKTSAGQADIAIRIWPRRESKGRVVCFHEAACSGAEFAFLAESLNAAGFEVVAPDLIGHGRSTYFGDPNAYQWIDFVNCTARIIQRYADKSTHLVGASFGGMLLFVYMLASRIEPRSATFVDIPLYSTASDSSVSLMMSLIRSDFSSLAEAKAHFEGCRHPLHSDALHLATYLTENRFQLAEGKVRIRADRYVMDLYDARLRKGRGQAAGFNYLEAIGALRSNCLFVYGADSPNRNTGVFRKLSRQYPNLTFETIEGTHPPPLMSFEQVRPILDHIRRYTPG